MAFKRVSKVGAAGDCTITIECSFSFTDAPDLGKQLHRLQSALNCAGFTQTTQAQVPGTLNEEAIVIDLLTGRFFPAAQTEEQEASAAYADVEERR